jgi:uncharacterized glyoxalase superfamily protein PhnB
MGDQTPHVYPFLRYADADAALEWLRRAFGFEHVVVRRSAEDGTGPIRHAEVALGAGIVMFGQGELDHRGIYVAVEDPDGHYERAKAAGAEMVSELANTDYGSRGYTARDPEGNLWSFGTYRPSVGRGAAD